MLEFVLVFPIFFLTILCILDFSRYLLVRGLLNTAANRAVSQAAVVPGLDIDCNFLPPNMTEAQCRQERIDATKLVLDTAKRLPLDTLVGEQSGDRSTHFITGSAAEPAIDFIIDRNYDVRSYYVNGPDSTPAFSFPDAAYPTSPEPLRSALQLRPMEVTLRTQMVSFIPFVGRWTVIGHKAGFREVPNASSFPARMDCRGQIVPAGGSGAASCPCVANPNDPTVIADGSGCECLSPDMTPQTNPGGDIIHCTCPPPQVFNPDIPGCAPCPANQANVNDECVCVLQCGRGTANDACTACDCPDGTVSTNGICCPAGQIGNNGACVCPNNQVADGDVCGCPDDQDLSNGHCCPDGLQYNGGGCCPPGDQFSNGLCCPVDLVGVNGICCPPGQQNIGGVCGCPGTTQYDPVTRRCVCPGDLQDQGGGNCACPNNLQQVGDQCECPNGQVVTNNHCCPTGQVFAGGACCPTGTTNQGGICCPNGQVNTGGICCPPGYQNIGGVCGCPGQLVYRNNQCRCPIGTITGPGNTCPTCPQGTSPSGNICCPTGTSNSGGICCPNGTNNSGGLCCPHNTTNSGGICCPTGTVNVGGVCRCPGELVSGPGGCRCPGNQVNQGGNQCGCPAGLVQVGDNCQCPDGLELTNEGCVRPEF